LAQQDYGQAAKPAKPAPGPSPAAAYAAKLDQWKSLLKELRSLQSDFSTAEEAQAAEIRVKWDQAIARGKAMIAELRTAGMAAYAAAPQEDRDLERLMVNILMDDVAHDRYEEAAALSQTLLDNGCDIDKVFADGGLAAFSTNNFEKAEIYLKKAGEEGALSGKAAEFFGILEEYKGYWEEEQKIREAESQKGDLPRVRITTSAGEMVAELFENEAPDTVGNFVSLVEAGFYNGTKFHRVLKQFMAQGGCPKGDGTGGPGYEILCECYNDNFRKHFRGTLSMAHSGRDTGGSQFFITFLPTPHLNRNPLGGHTAFGRIVEGIEVLAKIQRIDPSASGDKSDPDTIEKIEVVRKREHEYKPNKVQ